MDCSVLQKKGQARTPLPESFKPLILTDDMDKEWLDLMKHLKTSGRRLEEVAKKSG